MKCTIAIALLAASLPAAVVGAKPKLRTRTAARQDDSIPNKETATEKAEEKAVDKVDKTNFITDNETAAEKAEKKALTAEKAAGDQPYTRPDGGFRGGQSCMKDFDCSGAGRGYWCNGGAWNSYGKCELCPAKCSGGCQQCDNDKSRLNCVHSDTLDKFACGADKAAEKEEEKAVQ